MFQDKLKAAFVEAGITVHTVPIVPTNNCTRYGYHVDGYKDASDEEKTLLDTKVITSFVEGFSKEHLKHAYVEPVNLDTDYLYVAVWGSTEPMIEQTESTIREYFVRVMEDDAHVILLDVPLPQGRKVSLSVEVDPTTKWVPPLNLRTMAEGIRDHILMTLDTVARIIGMEINEEEFSIQIESRWVGYGPPDDTTLWGVRDTLKKELGEGFEVLTQIPYPSKTLRRFEVSKVGEAVTAEEITKAAQLFRDALKLYGFTKAYAWYEVIKVNTHSLVVWGDV
jgi:hypothetical protein